jgi:signal transduction histidine kinase
MRVRWAPAAATAVTLGLTATALAAARDARAARDELSTRLESLAQLIGGVAHDLNNVVNVIQGYADFTAEQMSALAQDDPRLRPAVEDLEQVRSAAQQAVRLTRQLITTCNNDHTMSDKGNRM